MGVHHATIKGYARNILFIPSLYRCHLSYCIDSDSVQKFWTVGTMDLYVHDASYGAGCVGGRSRLRRPWWWAQQMVVTVEHLPQLVKNPTLPLSRPSSLCSCSPSEPNEAMATRILTSIQTEFTSIRSVRL